MPKNQTPNRLSLTASWVLPISERPLSEAVLVVEDGSIKALLSRDDWHRRFPGETLIDYGQAIITPGLINLHTHLDYSALRLFDTESGLFKWIPGLAGRAAAWNEDEWRQSALLGAEEIALSGTTLIADSSYSGAAVWAAAASGLRAVVALELFGVDEDSAGQRWDSWLSRVLSLQQSADEPVAQALRSGRVKLTVSPHAPYTVSPRLWRLAADWAKASGLPVLTHLCESAQEVRWIAGADEEIDAFLKVMVPGGASLPKPAWKGHGLTPVALLDSQNLLDKRTVAAHAVHVEADDITTLVKTGVAVAHCPRSNSRLRNGIAPFDLLIKSGVRVGFGTDSAASADDLDVLSEARFACNVARANDRSFARTSEEVLEMLTLRAAEILGLADEVGSLEPGKRADIAVFALKGRAACAADRPTDLLLYGEARLRELFVDGEQIVKDGDLKRKPLLACAGQEIPLF